MDDNTTLILAGMAALVLLVGVYLVTRPEPKQDVSFDQAIELVATVAAYW